MTLWKIIKLFGVSILFLLLLFALFDITKGISKDEFQHLKSLVLGMLAFEFAARA